MSSPHSRLLLCLIWSVLFFVLAGAVGHSSEAGMDASFGKIAAKTGQVVDLTISYQLPEGATLSAGFEVKGLEDLDVVERRAIPGRITYRILVDRVGDLRTKNLSLTCESSDKEKIVLVSDPVSMDILTNIGKDPDKVQLKPLRDIVYSRSVWLRYLMWIGIFAVGILMVCGFIWWFKKRKQNNVVDTEPCHVLAKRQIQELVALGLVERQEAKAFYFRLSAVMKQYAGALRGFPAADFTTEEIARHLEGDDRDLVDLLRRFDLIKFADARVEPLQAKADIKNAIVYIDKTRPQVLDEDPTGTDKGAVS
ncbi:MAG: hypothetical protein U9P80_08955 [Thermodesulfobacteriota bacterium]|nr:hypothetical protein [Thermodesulfobacteriota bacterium]